MNAFAISILFACAFATVSVRGQGAYGGPPGLPGNNCSISDAALLSAGTSSIHCDATDPSFCKNCLCSLVSSIVVAFQAEASRLGTNWCSANTNGVLADCEAEYIYLLFKNNVLTDTIAQELGTCSGQFDYTTCPDWSNWSTWYDTRCGGTPSGTPSPAPSGSPAPTPTPSPKPTPGSPPPKSSAEGAKRVGVLAVVLGGALVMLAAVL